MAGLPRYEPMIPQLGSLPAERERDRFGAEMKWDGMRVLLYVEGGRVQLRSRNGAEVSAAFPELQMLAGATGGHDLVLDGEIVAFDAEGRVSFSALQPRMHTRKPARVAELVRTVPVTVMLFDLLHLGPFSQVRKPYTERRALLESAVRPGPRWQVPVWFPDHAERALQASEQLGLEGVVFKRLEGPYRPGRSHDWVKVVHAEHVEAVIGGWRPSSRGSGVGSLLLGVPDEAGRLLYIGSVGTGFTAAAARDLAERLAPLARDVSPFVSHVPREHASGARWVEPSLVGEVRARSSGHGYLRHSSWRGLRLDKVPGDVPPLRWRAQG